MNDIVKLYNELLEKSKEEHEYIIKNIEYDHTELERIVLAKRIIRDKIEKASKNSKMQGRLIENRELIRALITETMNVEAENQKLYEQKIMATQKAILHIDKSKKLKSAYEQGNSSNLFLDEKK